MAGALIEGMTAILDGHDGDEVKGFQEMCQYSVDS